MERIIQHENLRLIGSAVIKIHNKLTPAASDSNKHEYRGSSCDGTRKCGIGGGSAAENLFPKYVFISSTTVCYMNYEERGKRELDS